MVTNTLSQRRGFVPLPVVCISKKKLWLQGDAYYPVPDDIAGQVELSPLDPAGEYSPLLWTVTMSRVQDSFKWTWTDWPINPVTGMSAELNLIDGSWTLDCFLRYEGWEGPNGTFSAKRAFIRAGGFPLAIAQMNFFVPGSVYGAGYMRVEYQPPAQ